MVNKFKSINVQRIQLNRKIEGEYMLCSKLLFRRFGNSFCDLYFMKLNIKKSENMQIKTNDIKSV